jgi:SAM-dependent methyltransferase
MERPQIRFEDGAAYEEFMGKWSRLAGDTFLQWLAPAPGLRWVDVGCGNGAFTEMLLERCAPLEVQGIDPSPEQLAFARSRLAANSPAAFRVGDAMALPYADDAFDAAVMALVIFFVPEPAKGVAEMARVVKPGGSVSAYSWDILGGGFPFAALQEEMAALGVAPLWPPSVAAAGLAVSRDLWQGAGLVQIETRQIEVQRSFDDFEAFWRIARTGPRLLPLLTAMSAEELARLKEGLRRRLPADAGGRVTCVARANAIKGRVPV